MSELGSYMENHIRFTDNRDEHFEVVFSGPELATDALIMVHGFGARKDSRGLFTELAETTRNEFMSVRADYSNIRGNESTALSFSQQVDRLKRVVEVCRQELKISREVYVGHSQGWIPIALSNPTNAEVLALAPPLGQAFLEFMQTPGWRRRGSELNTSSDSKLVRSDNSLTYAPRKYWDEFRALSNVTPLMRQMAGMNQVKIYFAGVDNVLGQQDAPKGIEVEEIMGANHDFIEAARQNLINKIVADLSTKN